MIKYTLSLIHVSNLIFQFPFATQIEHYEVFQSSHWRCSEKEGVRKNIPKFTGKSLCRRPEACNYIKNEQGFSCEFCEIFKNTCFKKHLRRRNFTKFTRMYRRFFRVNFVTYEWRLLENVFEKWIPTNIIP